ncbi:hypothetical protein [Streptomyces sp. 142MFCol3.1]|uniref:hypothetical protein n=1 Tax=Streptomyces sp. 142MFCol3.1 TaxID=1172179 RepID=UPI00041C57FB|nr:hypothetical protein [Streptomyces sp. 142MFCol3.1]
MADKVFAKAMATGIRYATDHGAKAINISSGSEARSSMYHQQTKNLLVSYSPKKPGFF